ncbi:MAG: DUF429 domain-containing protein [Gallionella sp.]|nr:DUF429 domain-containing protein [Gallionella sp.]
MVLLGFDPGGINSFGWATLHVDEVGKIVSLATGVVSNAPEAVRNALSTTSAPAGVGIDAPLFWVQEGDRRADSYLRDRVRAAGGHNGTVNSVNSLRGACLVQGILTARIITASWPSATITEAHPKALLRLHAEAERFVANHLPLIHQEHERDAALAAFAAWAAVTARQSWHNLVLEEADPFFPGGKEVSYWFPQ